MNTSILGKRLQSTRERMKEYRKTLTVAVFGTVILDMLYFLCEQTLLTDCLMLLTTTMMMMMMMMMKLNNASRHEEGNSRRHKQKTCFSWCLSVSLFMCLLAGYIGKKVVAV